MRVLRNLLTALLALVAGAVLTEGFLRALIPVEAQFETWFTPGIERWDETFGAVYRPDWQGTMRHMDGIYRGVPLTLDEHGFRLPVRNAIPGEPVRVLLMGGRSAMMSYGLPDEETVHARLVQAVDFPMEAQTVASAGGNLVRDWHRYLHELADQEWDLVIISHVNPYLRAYADRTAFDTVPAAAPREWVFQYMDGIQLWRDGLFMKAGPAAFASYLGYGLVRLADAGLKGIDRLRTGASGGLEAAIRRQAEAPPAEALEDYRAFLKHVEAHFAARGAPVLLHFIPRPLAARDHHAPYREPLSEDFDTVDLHRRLYPECSPDAFIANGHYDRELAARIGRALAGEVSARLFPIKP